MLWPPPVGASHFDFLVPRTVAELGLFGQQLIVVSLGLGDLLGAIPVLQPVEIRLLSCQVGLRLLQFLQQIERLQLDQHLVSCDTLALLHVDGSDSSSHPRADSDFVGFDESADLARDAAVLVKEDRRDEQRGDDSQDQEPLDHSGPHHLPGN